MLLEVENVSKSYEGAGAAARVHVLTGVSLSVETGEAVAIVGPSGSGKSTLLNLIGGLDHVDSGVVRLHGRVLSDLDEAGLAALRCRDMGFIFQLHHLLPQCTVMENCLLPTLPAAASVDHEAARARVLRLLQRVGLGERVDHRPGQLSGGECQRTAVVRALVNQPQLVLADEPTGSLDASTAKSLGRLLLELNHEEGMALIVVTHSEDLAKSMDRVLRLQGGRLV